MEVKHPPTTTSRLSRSRSSNSHPPSSTPSTFAPDSIDPNIQMVLDYLSRIDARLDYINTQFNSLHARVDRIKDHLNVHIDSMDAHLDNHPYSC